MKVERLAIFKNAKDGKHAGSDVRTIPIEEAIGELLPDERDCARACLLARATYRFHRVAGPLAVSGRIVPEDCIARDLHDAEALAR